MATFFAPVANKGGGENNTLSIQRLGRAEMISWALVGTACLSLVLGVAFVMSDSSSVSKIASAQGSPNSHVVTNSSLPLMPGQAESTPVAVPPFLSSSDTGTAVVITPTQTAIPFAGIKPIPQTPTPTQSQTPAPPPSQGSGNGNSGSSTPAVVPTQPGTTDTTPTTSGVPSTTVTTAPPTTEPPTTEPPTTQPPTTEPPTTEPPVTEPPTTAPPSLIDLGTVTVTVPPPPPDVTTSPDTTTATP